MRRSLNFLNFTPAATLTVPLFASAGLRIPMARPWPDTPGAARVTSRLWPATTVTI